MEKEAQKEVQTLRSKEELMGDIESGQKEETKDDLKEEVTSNSWKQEKLRPFLFLRVSFFMGSL